jgi:biotin carboxylase
VPDVPHVLLICPRPDVLGKLLGLPVAVSVVHRPGGDREFEQSCALQVVDAEFTDPEALLAAVAPVHAARPVDAVLGLTELCLRPAAAVAHLLGARANSPETLRCTQDKAAMRRRLAESGADTTAYRRCADLAEAREFLRGCPDGIVLKPVDGNGGTGVHLAREPAELERAWAWTTTATGGFGWSDRTRAPVAVLAEEHLGTAEFSVETLSAAGTHRLLAVTRKQTSGAPHFVELGHELPAVLPAGQEAAIGGAALAALDAIGYEWGPAHTEVILRPDGRAAVVEVNARQGGDQIWEMVQQSTGVDMIVGAVLTLAYGRPFWSAVTPRRGAAIRYLPAEPGEVVSVDGVADALALDGVVRVGELRRPGDVVPRLADSWDRNGWVLAAGPDTATAVATADRAAGLITVRTRQVAAERAEAR